MRKLKLLLISTILAISLPAQTGLSTEQSPGQLYLGHQGPDFKLKDLDGHELQLSSLRGQVVLLDFWATWCGPCRAEIPSLEHLAKQFEKKNVVVIGVDDGEDDEVVRKFAEQQKINYRIVLARGSNVPAQFGVRGLPTVAILDKNGIIAAYRVGEGPNTENMLHDDLRQITGDKYEAPAPKTPDLPKVETRTVPPPLSLQQRGPNPNWQPQSTQDLLARGYRYLHTNQTAQAILDADAVLKAEPASFSALLLRAEAAYAAKNYSAVILDCDQLIRMKPELSQPYHLRGLSYSYSGQHEKAIPDYQKEIALSPNSIGGYNSLGWAYLELGQFDKARVNLDKAIELMPDFTTARENRAKLLAKLGDRDGQIKELKLIVGLMPSNTWAKNTLDANGVRVETASSGDDARTCVIPAVKIDAAAPRDSSLTAPKLVSPAEGAVFGFFPRLTACEWEAVADAVSYLVETDFSYDGKWDSEVHKVEWGHPVTGTRYTFEFVGAQPGRWRVRPVNAKGTLGMPSEWRGFRYTR